MSDFSLFVFERLKKLLELTENQKLYLVGGFWREKLSGIISTDLDFILFQDTILLAKELASKTGGFFVLLDSDRETARIVWNKEKNGYDLNFDLALISGGSLENDLQSRDLTINSLCMEINYANFADILRNDYLPSPSLFINSDRGFQDFNLKILRTSGEENLLSDPLRILRVFRFAAKMDFLIEEQTFGYLKKLAYLINQPAKERVIKELKDIFLTNNLAKSLKKMEKVNLLSILFSDFYQQEFFAKVCEYLDIFENMPESEGLNLLKELSEPLLLKFSLFFLGFYQKEEDAYSKKLEKALKDYHLSSFESQYILKVFRYTVEISEMSALSLNRKELFRYFQKLKGILPEVLLVSLIKAIQEKKQNTLENCKYLINIYLNDPLLVNPPQLVDGKFILETFGLKSGPLIGELLRKVQEEQVEGFVKNINDAEVFLLSILGDDAKKKEAF